MTALAIALALQQGLAAHLDRANDPDKPQYHLQAIQKLREAGPAAAAEAAAWVEQRGPAAMSLAFTQFLGELRDARVERLLVSLVENKDFFWRPAATQALAEHRSRERVRLFRALLKDPLWGVRAGAVYGLEALGDAESLPLIRPMLDDEIYDVRAQAAKTMHALGDETGLPVLVEALRSSVAWFEIDYGQIAREDAWNFLKKVAKDDFGYKPWESVSERAAGLARWEAWIARKFPAWREMVPPRARAVADTASYVFGFELRSCRRGDFFFRIDQAGNFVLGNFNLQRAPLTREERARFDAALEAARAIDFELPYGQGGCDFEQYYLPGQGKRWRKLWIGIGGRPHALEPFIRVCHDLIKAKFGDAEAADFRERSSLFREVE